MYFLTIKLHFPLVCEIQHSVFSTTQLYNSFCPSFQSSYSYLFLFFPSFMTPHFGPSSLLPHLLPIHVPPPFLSVACQQGKARSDCQATSEPRGGSAGIKDGTMWPIFSMPQCSEDTVWPCQNQSYVGPSLDMSFADALSFQVVCQKFLW